MNTHTFKVKYPWPNYTPLHHRKCTINNYLVHEFSAFDNSNYLLVGSVLARIIPLGGPLPTVV